MAKRWNITSVPEEIDKLVREDGKARRETVPQTVLRIVCNRLLGSVGNTSTPTQPRRGRDTAPTQTKFEPPTILEAQKEISEKGYHFGAEEFVAFYAARGWKLKSGAMKDWKAAMVTWESRWRQEHGVVEEQPRVGQVVKAVKCATCGDEGMVMQRPEVAGPRLIPCPACSGGGLWTGMGSGN